jgi:endonuclease/exonuclease/phosphatase family metal-dependent hydrolase
MKVVADVVRDYDPDIMMFQEVDRNSKRSHHEDQLKGILKHFEAEGPQYGYIASTHYHQVCYVPAPSHEHMGKVDFHLVCMSKYPIVNATRYQLPLLQESCVMQFFNLKRAIMDVRIPIAGGGTFSCLNTHLSAFAFNDGTPEKEIAMIDQHLQHL